jgi:hypothetical protein
MKSAISKPAFLNCFAVGVLLCAISGVFAESGESMKVNEDAFAFAARLINQGYVTADAKGAWTTHRPSVKAENDFIRLHGFGEYAKWHLGIDNRYSVNTKRRYKFPCGDFVNVHRCGLLAARSRAAQYKYSDIEHAAARLIEMIRQKKNSRYGICSGGL